jgi:hypothetical protein
MKFKTIEKNIEEIKKKNSSDFQEKRNQIIMELDCLLDKERDLLDIVKEYELAKRAINSDYSLINSVIDEYWGYKMGKTFFESIFEKKHAYHNEYYAFAFKLHKVICAPNLYDKSINHYNYLIPLGFNANRLPNLSHDALEDIKESKSIDTEFYQIGLLSQWGKFIFEKNFDIDYKDICNIFLNDFGNFNYSDIAVTKSSKGKSRVENSLDQIKRIFRKVGVIDKKNRLTIFGKFIIRVMHTTPSRLLSPEDMRGIKGQSKMLAKSINDLIFNFDLNDFDKLRIPESSFENLKIQIDKYKSDSKNIEIYNLPIYPIN